MNCFTLNVEALLSLFLVNDQLLKNYRLFVLKMQNSTNSHLSFANLIILWILMNLTMLKSDESIATITLVFNHCRII